MCLKSPKLKNISSEQAVAAPDLVEQPEAVQFGGTARDESDKKTTGKKSVTIAKPENTTKSRSYV